MATSSSPKARLSRAIRLMCAVPTPCARQSNQLRTSGGCDFQGWKPLRSVASAVIIPAARGTRAFPLPGASGFKPLASSLRLS